MRNPQGRPRRAIRASSPSDLSTRSTQQSACSGAGFGPRDATGRHIESARSVSLAASTMHEHVTGSPRAPPHPATSGVYGCRATYGPAFRLQSCTPRPQSAKRSLSALVADLLGEPATPMASGARTASNTPQGPTCSGTGLVSAVGCFVAEPPAVARETVRLLAPRRTLPRSTPPTATSPATPPPSPPKPSPSPHQAHVTAHRPNPSKTPAPQPPVLLPTRFEAGVSVTVVSRRLGHSGPTMTLEVYGHVLPDADADAAERLEALLADAPPEDPSG